jgi:glutathione S-transferase
MLKIWGRSNSINVQKVLWCCEELGLDYERIEAGHNFGVTDTPMYTAMNPNGLVPTIANGRFQLWESNVIVRYLAHTHGYDYLCPAEIEQRFDAERWMDWQATTLWPALRPIFVSLIRTPEHQRDQAAVSKAESQCASAMKILDAQLAGRPFVTGGSLTMGDIPVGAAVHRWYALDIERPHLPNLARWYDALCTRSAFSTTVMAPLS